MPAALMTTDHATTSWKWQKSRKRRNCQERIRLMECHLCQNFQTYSVLPSSYCELFGACAFDENTGQLQSPSDVYVVTPQDSSYWCPISIWAVLRGMNTLLGKVTLSKLFVPFCWGFYSKGKNWLPLGANSFLLEQTPFQMEFDMQKSKQQAPWEQMHSL